MVMPGTFACSEAFRSLVTLAVRVLATASKSDCWMTCSVRASAPPVTVVFVTDRLGKEGLTMNVTVPGAALPPEPGLRARMGTAAEEPETGTLARVWVSYCVPPAVATTWPAATTVGEVQDRSQRNVTCPLA